MTTVTPDVSVVIPTYNEAGVAGDVIDHVLRECFTASLESEVIVVDDDSPDGTAAILQDRFQNSDRVTIHRRTDESGLGSAIVDGIAHASGTTIVVMDADGQHPPEQVPNLAYRVQDSDVQDVMVLGSRYRDGGDVEGWSQLRRVVSWGGSIVAWLALARSWGIRDPMTGFFAFPHSLVDDVELDGDGWKVALEVLERCRPRRVVEVPYTFRDRRRGESSLGVGDTIRFIGQSVRLSLPSRRYLGGVVGLFVGAGMMAGVSNAYWPVAASLVVLFATAISRSVKPVLDTEVEVADG